MDFLTCHLGHLPRRHPSLFPVQNIGHVGKDARGFIRARPFSTLNFSLVLEGSGTYQVDGGAEIRVQAPHVLTQCERHAYTYGPGPGGYWRELFLMFPLESRPAWERAGLYHPERQAWPVQNAQDLVSRVNLLFKALPQREAEGMADVIDRLCELIVLESLRSASLLPAHPRSERLESLRREIDADPARPRDLPRLARDCGMSYSAFRRQWRECYGKSPGQYLAERRIQEARRLLAETDWPVGRIALELGFEDPLYFSRRFHQQAGMTASEYRRLNESD